MAKVTEAHLAARRRQILDAALACFARKGFHQATMPDICQEADLSPGAVYRYFDSKDAIIAAICDEGTERARQRFAEAAATGDTMQALDLLGRELIHDLDGKSLSLEVWAEASRNPRIGAAVRRSMATQAELLADLVRAGQRRGEVLAGVDAEAAARVLIAMVDGLVLQKLVNPELDAQRCLKTAKTAIAGMLFPAAQRERHEGRD